MTCSDLDGLRTASRHSGSNSWPREAKDHLESCDRCAQLQAALDGSSQIRMPDELRSRIESSILPGLRAVAVLPSAGRLTAMLLLAVAIAGALATWQWGTSGWDARNALQSSVSFVLLGASGLALADALSHSMIPGSSRSFATWMYFTFPLLALAAANIEMFSYHPNPRFAQQAIWCWQIGIASAALASPLFWIVMRRGYSLTPIKQSALCGLLAGLVAIAVLEMHCPQLDWLHISVSHLGAAVTAAIVGTIWGAVRDRIERAA